MADEIDAATEAREFIPIIYRPGFLKALYARAVAKARVLVADGDVKAMGDKLNIRIAAVGVVNDVTQTTGAITNQALTATMSQLLVNKWKDYSFEIVDMAAKQAEAQLEASLTDGAPKAFAKQIDIDLLALHGDFTSNTAIDATGGLIVDRLTEAFYALAIREIDMDDPNNLSWIFHWKQWPVLKAIAKLSDANLTGEGVGGLLKFKIPDILGLPVYFTTGVASATAEHKNMLFHREAMACGVQENFKMEKLARVRKSTPYSADMLYGVKSVRTTHGQVIRTLA